MTLKPSNINQKDLLERIQNYLYSFYAKSIENARVNEIYDCLCRALMEDIGKSWVESKSNNEDFEVYVLSFEYLPGKLIDNFIYKLGMEDTISEILEKIGFSYKEIINFEKEANIGAGDIGIGSTYIIRELANRNIRSVAYALRYENGNLKQKIVDGRQVEYSEYWLAEGSNWEHKKGFSYDILIDGRINKSFVYDVPVLSDKADFISTLRLFQAEPSEAINYSDFTRGDFFKAYDEYIRASSINQFLYLDDSSFDGKLIRLKQEYFYTASAIRDIFKRYKARYGSLENIESRIKIISNDIHPTLALVEFIRILTDDFKFELKKSIGITRSIFDHLAFSVTDDTLETYGIDMIKRINPDLLRTIMNIQQELLLEDRSFKIINNGIVYFKNINLALSNQYFYLSKGLKESKNSKRPLDYVSLGTDRILYVQSNNRRMMDLLKDYGIRSTSYEEIKKIKDLREDTNFMDGLEEVKSLNKKDLINLSKEKINPYSMFDVQLSIIHESKRQILNALAIAYKFFLLRENSNLAYTPTTYIFAGKANEGYFMAKETIKFILALKKLIDGDKIIREAMKIVFIEDIDVRKSRYILKGADIYNNLTLASLDNEDFHLLNSSLNMSNIISTRGGIIDNIGRNHSIYQLGEKIDDLLAFDYDAHNFYYSNDMVKYTIENLIKEDHKSFPYDFKIIYDQLMIYNDSFRVVKDLEDLAKTKAKTELDYLDKYKWVGQEIDNILWANNFKLDEKILRKSRNDKTSK
ncbi:MAG: glycogen/starch/alpha-glucan phosphorylase [Anaerococcus sp.]|nr:glycogen/starch/alpha-glucan phosphorylase [Anaerococcus sp.]